MVDDDRKRGAGSKVAANALPFKLSPIARGNDAASHDKNVVSALFLQEFATFGNSVKCAPLRRLMAIASTSSSIAMFAA